jgi:hypothetical protein
MILDSFGFYLGSAAVLAWASRDAHRPVRSSTVRYATDQRRYLLALGLYAGTFFAIFVFAVLGTRLATAALEIEVSDSTLSLAVAVLIVTLMPRLPWQSRVLKPFRRIAMAIAGFPGDVERLVTQMHRPGALPDVIDQLDEALAAYGSSVAAVRAWMAASSFASLIEAAHLRSVLQREQDRAETDRGRLFLRSNRRFFEARGAQINDINTAWRKLVRRSAMAADLVTDAKMSGELAAPISEFLAEEAEEIVRDLQRLLAEYALSRIWQPEARTAFFGEFGYRIPSFAPPPVGPLLLIAALELLLFGAAFVGPLLFGGQGAMGGNPVMLLLHATGMVLAVAFSIYPKFFLNSARPSLRTLPWKSNLVCTAGAYVAGVLVSLAALPLRPASPSMPPYAFVFGGSFFFAAVTFGICIAVDLRLRDHARATRRMAARDALLLGALLLGVDLLLRLFVRVILGATMPSPAVVMPVIAGLGALIGWFIPGMVVQYLGLELPRPLRSAPALLPRRLADQRAAASLLLESSRDVH